MQIMEIHVNTLQLATFVFKVAARTFMSIASYSYNICILHRSYYSFSTLSALFAYIAIVQKEFNCISVAISNTCHTESCHTEFPSIARVLLLSIYGLSFNVNVSQAHQAVPVYQVAMHYKLMATIVHAYHGIFALLATPCFVFTHYFPLE